MPSDNLSQTQSNRDGSKEKLCSHSSNATGTTSKRKPPTVSGGVGNAGSDESSVFSGRLTYEATWEELEEILISADVGVDTSLRLIEELRSQIREEGIGDAETAFDRLKQTIARDLETGASPTAWLEAPPTDTPYVILMVGVNGVGKTTSIAKLAHHLTKEGKKVVLGAADTFRAAAEEQLEILGSRVGVEVISHQPGADPGAVAYDAYQASKSRGADVLIVDTAGRLHTRSNLMEELKKVHRVINRLDSAAPQQVILTLDATTGLNGLTQAHAFTQAVGCTGIFLAKAGRHGTRRHCAGYKARAKGANSFYRHRGVSGGHCSL
ncbi:Signal recognition particle receptor FtsY [Geodia barretti]|nr:Signal recognition particle receptor FtsY [Geodia barretti]